MSVLSIFSPRGRLGRLAWIGLLLVIGCMIVAIMHKKEMMAENHPIFFITSIFFLVYWSYAISIKRLHDFNKSGWHSLWFLLPIANTILFFVLLIKAGTDGPNDYDDF